MLGAYRWQWLDTFNAPPHLKDGEPVEPVDGYRVAESDDGHSGGDFALTGMDTPPGH